MEIIVGLIIFIIVSIIFFRKDIEASIKSLKKNEEVQTEINVEQENKLVVQVPLVVESEIEKKEPEKIIVNKVSVPYTKPPYKLPNKEMIINSQEFKNALRENELCIGKNVNGYIYENINKMENMLIGGTVYSGKTTFINTLICNILMTQKPDDVKLLLIDTKKIDYAIYNGIPHLLTPVITNCKKACIALRIISKIIDERYDLLSITQSKNIEDYNTNILNQNNKIKLNKMYNIFVIIDDFSELSEFEEAKNIIEDIAVTCSLVGIHIIASTSNPSRKCITDDIRVGMSSRVCFKMPEKRFSRLILDETGAKLIAGHNELMYKSYSHELEKIKLCDISDDDIEKIIMYITSLSSTNYDSEFNIKINNEMNKSFYNDIRDKSDKAQYDDPLYNDILNFAREVGYISASLIQRRFRLGYSRAARLIDLLEERRIIGPQEDSKPRKVLIGKIN